MLKVNIKKGEEFFEGYAMNIELVMLKGNKKEDREKKQDLNNGNMKENTFESNSK